MRKFLLIIFGIATLGSLGHDVYLYQQKPQNGFAFAAIGTMWSKYHPETFTQWKVKTEEVSKKIDSVTKGVIEQGSTLLPLPESSETTEERVKAPYEEAFDQTDVKEGGPAIKQVRRVKEEDLKQSNLQKMISIVLAQKATLLLGGITLFIFLVGWIFGRIKRMKEAAAMPKGARGKKIPPKQRKGGGYSYSRK